MADPEITTLLARTHPDPSRRGRRCPAEARLVAWAAGKLAGSDREAFESHLAGCDFCLGQAGFLARADALGEPPAVPTPLLEAARVGRSEGPGRIRRYAVPAAAAAGLAASLFVIAAIWSRSAEPRPEVAAAPSIEPYPYEAVVLRGAEEPPANRFGEAMSLYQARDWSGAAAALAVVAREQPDRAQVRFYLGVSLLLAGRSQEAMNALERAALLDEGYREDALRYLALARARRDSPPPAEREGGRAD